MCPPPTHGPTHPTASAVVFNARDEVLLVHHLGYQAWVFPGGHIDGDEASAGAAVRELLEETGVHVRLLEGGPWQEALYDSAPYSGQLPHKHLDALYVARADGDQPLVAQVDEVAAVRWVPLAELAGLRVRREVPEVAAAALEHVRSLP